MHSILVSRIDLDLCQFLFPKFHQMFAFSSSVLLFYKKALFARRTFSSTEMEIFVWNFFWVEFYIGKILTSVSLYVRIYPDLSFLSLGIERLRTIISMKTGLDFLLGWISCYRNVRFVNLELRQHIVGMYSRQDSQLRLKKYSAYHQIVTIKISKTVTIWRIFDFSSVFSWQFSKNFQKIAKRNCLVVGIDH